MDVQPRASEYGARRHHACHEVGDGRLAPLLATARSGGITGAPVPELCREHGISSATFYKWRSKFGGMDVSMVARMKELEEENRRLKKMYAEAQLSTDLLKEALAKKW
ncbi:hypothetical protein DGM85_10100 [Xanthomonas phaseoli pv. phaseoli]|nr:hypothetical protein DGM85_10100 [Xanthomonas phaseoli pv. phaseoli]